MNFFDKKRDQILSDDQIRQELLTQGVDANGAYRLRYSSAERHTAISMADSLGLEPAGRQNGRLFFQPKAGAGHEF